MAEAGLLARGLALAPGWPALREGESGPTGEAWADGPEREVSAGRLA